MINYLKNILTSLMIKNSVNKEDESHQKQDVSVIDVQQHDYTRSPPTDLGFELISTDDLLKNQVELLHEIRQTAGICKEDFEKMFMPVIVRFAKYVQLVPASRDYHHFFPGGLLRHSLETAFYSLRFAEGTIFAARETSEVRRHLEPRWRFATFLAGLTHDIGKPVSDLIITNKDASKKWIPLNISLTDWLIQENIDRYFVEFNTKRIHKQHEAFTTLVFRHIATQEIYEYLTEYNSEIIAQMLLAINGQQNKKNPIYEIVKKADSESTKRNRLGQVSLFGGRDLPVPLERHILYALKELCEEKWDINKPGAKVWVTDSAVYIVWKTAAADVRNNLLKQGIEHIPSNYDDVADRLLSAGLAELLIKENGLESRYWPFYPIMEEMELTELKCLKIVNRESLFEVVPPMSIEYATSKEEAEAIKNGKYKQEGTVQDKKKNINVEKKANSGNKKETVDKDSKEEEKTEVIPEKKESESIDSKSKINQKSNMDTDISPELKKEWVKASKALNHKDAAGSLLLAIAEDIDSNELQKDIDWFESEGKKLAIVAANLQNSYGYSPSVLNEKEYIELDMEKPGLILRDYKHNKKTYKVIILTKRISQYMETVLKIKPWKKEQNRSGNVENRQVIEVVKNLIEKIKKKIDVPAKLIDDKLLINVDSFMGYLGENKFSDTVLSELLADKNIIKNGNLFEHERDNEQYYVYQVPEEILNEA